MTVARGPNPRAAALQATPASVGPGAYGEVASIKARPNFAGFASSDPRLKQRCVFESFSAVALCRKRVEIREVIVPMNPTRSLGKQPGPGDYRPERVSTLHVDYHSTRCSARVLLVFLLAPRLSLYTHHRVAVARAPNLQRLERLRFDCAESGAHSPGLHGLHGPHRC